MTWFKNKRFDFTFFILSPIVSIVLAAVFIFAGSPPAWTAAIYLGFTAFFDQPHIFLTFSRTHFDGHEFTRHLALHTVGLVSIVAVSGWMMMFHRSVFLWIFHGLGSFHIYRQNVGFFRVYSHTRHTPEIRNKLEVIYTLMFLNSWVTGLWSTGPVHLVSLGAQALLFTLLFHSTKDNLKSAALWLLALSALANWTSYAYIHDDLVGNAVETIYHNIQYFGFMWLYMQRAHPRPMNFSKLLVITAFVYGILIAAGTGVIHEDAVLTWPLVLMLSLVIYHYIAEAFIWKFRSQKELAAILVNR